MRQLRVFESISVDGYFTDQQSEEHHAFRCGNIVVTYAGK
jgi:hypothetical protein